MKKLNNVTKAILSAVSASNTMYAATKEAAAAAAKQLDKKLPVLEAVDAVVMLYREEFADNHNVRAIFKDSLILHAAGSKKVAVTTKTKGGEITEVMAASKAADLAKHSMRQAASTVRKELGGGRSTGGRKAAAEKPVNNVATLPMRSAKLSDINAISNADLLALVTERLSDDKFTTTLKTALARKGYTLTVKKSA